MIAVKEYIARLEQGYTEAFLCRGEDGHTYVAKSRLSGKESLVREWLCGNVGRELGIPIPPFEMLYAARSIATFSGNEDMAALAESPGFGSRFVGGAGEGVFPGFPLLNAADVPAIDVGVRRRVLLFDWWVRNFDRTDDNPNLLWDPLQRALHVIDHNLAFDSAPDEKFWPGHIFRADRAGLSDPAFRDGHLPLMEGALARLPTIWSEMPESWIEAVALTVEHVDTILRRGLTEEFWCPQ